MSELFDKQTLTTGDIAKYCGVNFRTVIRWIDRGHLKAFKLPGRGDNRVSLNDFVTFLKSNQMPIPEELMLFSKKALIVDDDITIATTIKKVLEGLGFETQLAQDGFIAGSKLSMFKPSIITLDLSMPGLSGFDVLKYLKATEGLEAIRILVISSLSDDKLQEAMNAGADDFLKKPIVKEELIHKVSRLLD